jgi:hypothetical protein
LREASQPFNALRAKNTSSSALNSGEKPISPKYSWVASKFLATSSFANISSSLSTSSNS